MATAPMMFLARYLKDTQLVPIRGKECTSANAANRREFPTLVIATSDLPTILGADIENAVHQHAQLFSSVMFINDAGKLNVKRLPTEAQFSAVMGIIVRDFDKDGKKDILLAGNKFDVEVETTAADASVGLLMKGMGSLNFKSLKSFESGIFLPYNVKDIQAIPVNDDWAIVVGSNNDKLRVFSQVAGHPPRVLVAK
jgi:hypothetical protein